jgi:hypothetical protein
MNSRTSRFSWSVLLTGVFILGVSAPAHASHENNLLDPDNTTQCVKSPSIVPKTVIARDQGFAQLDRTDIDTQYCTGDDIWVQDYTYGATGWYGQAFCDDKTLTGRCDIYIVQFNESTYGGSTNSWLRSLGCHEFGHTGSIGHRSNSNDTDNNSCMHSGISPETYDSHDINAINGGV